MSHHEITLRVNGTSRTAVVPARMTLVDFLRDELRLTGTHVGCEHGICGACTVQFDGKPIRSCLMFAVQAQGHDITTVEGLSGAEGALSALQEAFCENHALQCGYCTPGMLVAAQALLDACPDPSDDAIRDALSANICRCTGYVQIIEAVRLAATRLRARSGTDKEVGGG
ncbi:MAG TPA: (2Fe-2S)-binding protein [Burkholderiales bacterium]|jgi:carbon-monoxide dehydrogenase small subunit|nr:(2Fe-2S)-binding protein [Burkholderiales bacterium]